MTKVGKNSFIELMRFLFAMMIFLHHSGFLVGDSTDYPFKVAGFYAVEFFFILTGALAMKHISTVSEVEEPMRYSMGYTLNKLLRVWPYAAFGIVLSYVWYFLQVPSGVSLHDRIFGRWNIIFEMLFLPMTGVMDTSLVAFLNTPLWYLSVLLIGLPLVLYLALKLRDLFSCYLCWLLPLILHAFLIQKYGAIGNWGEYTGFLYSGVIRGIADIMLGCFVFVLAEIIVKTDKLPVWLLSIVEVGAYAFAVYTFSSNVDGYSYEFAVIVLALGISISLSGRSITYKIGDNKAVCHLGALSLPIYCLHWPVYRFVTLYAAGIDYAMGVILALIICVLISEVMMFVLNRLPLSKKIG